MATSKKRSPSHGAAGDQHPPPETPRPEDRVPTTVPAGISVDDLRQSLASGKASWAVRRDLARGAPVPRHLLGGDAASFLPASQAEAVDWEKVSSGALPADVKLLKRRIELGLVSASQRPQVDELLKSLKPRRAKRAASAQSGRKAAPKKAARKTSGGRK